MCFPLDELIVKTPNRSIKPEYANASAKSIIYETDESFVHNSPTDEVNFSFESVKSDTETTLNTSYKSLSRKLFEKSLQNSPKRHPIDEDIDALDESNGFSFPTEENHLQMIKPMLTCNVSTEFQQNTRVNDQTPNEDSIEISDDEFEYSLQISRNNMPSSTDDKTPHDESIEISDDEINYSMSHESPLSPPRRRKYPFLQPNERPAFNESLHQIFDDNFELQIPLNNQPTDELDLINQSVRSIVRKDFVSNTKPRPRGSSSGTPLHRTTSAMLGNVSNKQPAKYLSRIDDSITKDFSMNYDSFDDLLQGLTLPDSGRQSIKSPLPKDDEHQFTVTHDGCSFEVKIGERCVSPKPNFETMDSPTISRQLNKYGLKPLVRRKAIICLEHIYNRMHPLVECPNEESRLTRYDFDGQEHDKCAEPLTLEDSLTLQTDSLQLYTTKNSSTKSLPSNYFVYFMNVQSEYFLPSPPRAKVPIADSTRI